MGDNVFLASGDACGACQALDGTKGASRPHANCQCQTVPEGDDCDYDFVPHGIARYGPGKYDFTFGGELTVTCPDGSDGGGMSVEFDASGYDPDGGWSDFAQPLIDAAAEELCAQCQPADESPGVV